MLDFPELFVPESRVKGRMSIARSSAMDLNPETSS